MDINMMLEMLKRYNAGEIDLSDEEAQQLANLAFQYKAKFKTKSKPIRKGLFDLIDTAALGMVPNEWRPTSPGQDLHGESSMDKVAGGIGSLGGLAVPVMGAMKMAPKIAQYAGMAKGSASDGLKSAIAKIKENDNMKRSWENLSNYYNKDRNPYNINFDDITTGW